jgi:hypothetical protein
VRHHPSGFEGFFEGSLRWSPQQQQDIPRLLEIAGSSGWKSCLCPDASTSAAKITADPTADPFSLAQRRASNRPRVDAFHKA